MALTPAQARRKRQEIEVVRLLNEAEAKGTKKTAAVPEIAQIVGISERTIFSIIKNSKEHEQR